MSTLHGGLIEITLTVPLHELLMNFTSESEQIMKTCKESVEFYFFNVEL